MILPIFDRELSNAIFTIVFSIIYNFNILNIIIIVLKSTAIFTSTEYCLKRTFSRKKERSLPLKEAY